MADEETTEQTPAEVSEDDVKRIVGEAIEDKFSSLGLTDKLAKLDILDSLESLFETHKGESSDSLLEKIGGMIDEKLKGVASEGKSSETGNGKTERQPKLRIFS